MNRIIRATRNEGRHVALFSIEVLGKVVTGSYLLNKVLQKSLTVQFVVVIPIAPRFMMIVAFCLYDFRIIFLKLTILLREYSLNILNFPYFAI